MSQSDDAASIRRAAWDKIVKTLDELADAPELFPLEARGAEFFVWELKRICRDIGDHVESGSLDEAMEKLAAGFGRATGGAPHERSRKFREMARQEWSRDRGGGCRTKQEYAEAFALRIADQHTTSVENIRDRWLKGLPA